MREFGRDPGALGIEARVNAASGDPNEWMTRLAAWADLGASHLSVNTMGGGFTGLDQHLAALERFAQAAQLG